eukprot:TRINITY_DN30589_c0_g1_i1.p2 TRINITY_DN30589_c0_g1~~TRINITY_DN30589_c0_g1_i1.p2  ORF type:complete len:115 (+),score=6.89 TRINITY_DN30589_c0_g1_i1:70-414(+)
MICLIFGLHCCGYCSFFFVFFFNDTATTEIYTRSIVGSVRCVQETDSFSSSRSNQSDRTVTIASIGNCSQSIPCLLRLQEGFMGSSFCSINFSKSFTKSTSLIFGRVSGALGSS